MLKRSTISIILLTFLYLYCPLFIQAQPNLDSLRNIWEDKNQPDSSRLRAIGIIAWDGYLFSQPDSAFYFAQLQYELAEKTGHKQKMYSALNIQGVSFAVRGDYSKAIEYFTRGIKVQEEIGDTLGVAASLINIGNIYNNQGLYSKAIDYYHRGLKICEQHNDQENTGNTLNNIGNIYGAQGEYDKAIEYYTRSLNIAITAGDKRSTAMALVNLGTIYNQQEKFDKSLDNYRKGLAIREEIGDKDGIANSLNNIGGVYQDLGDYDKALDYHMRSLKISEEIKDRISIASSLNNIGKVYQKLGKHTKAIDYCSKALALSKEMRADPEIKAAANTLYESYKGLKQNDKALKMYELYVTTRDSLESKENKREVIRHEYKYEYEKQALADSLEFAKKEAVKNIELEKQQANISRQRIALSSGAGGLILLGILAFSVYRGKKRSDGLLLNILPSETARELKKNGFCKARHFDQATILFSDFQAFTETAEKMDASDLVAEIHTCFEAFDQICEKHQIEKIKTIGDAYMAAGGLPVPTKSSAKNTVLAALEMQSFISLRKVENEVKGKYAFEMRVGIHTGPVVAGIVGVKKFQYDIWGDTVNTASRMESSGEVGKVNISQSTYDSLKEDPQFQFEARGKIEAKGKGEVEMYFVKAT